MDLDGGCWPVPNQWVLPHSTWARGEIPESPESLIENLVQRVNRRRFHFELGDSSSGPRLSRSQAQAYDYDRSNANRRDRVLGPTNEINLNDLGIQKRVVLRKVGNCQEKDEVVDFYWLGCLGRIFELNKHKRLDEVSMQYLQSIFTTLWTLWNHRNRVVHEGIHPNPIEVILTAQKFSCRYPNIFSNAIQPNQQRVHLNSGQTSIGWNWQVLIKIRRKKKHTNRSTYAYEARTVQGNCIFLGTFSCEAKFALGAAQEALMDALLKARDMGYQRILVLCNSSRLVQVSNLVRAPNWQEQTMVSDILSLQQNGLLCKLLFVPNIVLSHVCYLAD
ncbi:hypothetical protein SO802_010720 [Lithocarpus litseifolius]|uniref:RNase H type-1 domain-containing protein n=1 Tax=Lithocarpus litseifolius TaxID=425828 RepID=A0AAW2DHZ2_9ROSI